MLARMHLGDAIMDMFLRRRWLRLYRLAVLRGDRLAQITLWEAMRRQSMGPQPPWSESEMRAAWGDR